MFKDINIFGIWCLWASDRQMMFMVILAGALGSFTRLWTSFRYLGNRELSSNLIWFFILRIPIGIALALVFYCIIRGGLLVPEVQVQQQAELTRASLGINPYSIAAFSALIAMFSKQATDKLAAVFEVAFAMKKPVAREGALGPSQPLKVAPPPSS